MTVEIDARICVSRKVVVCPRIPTKQKSFVFRAETGTRGVGTR